MIKIFFILLFFPLLIQAQTINISFNNGRAFLVPTYNEWCVCEKVDTLPNLRDIFGNATTVNIVRPKGLSFFDNGIGYLAGKSIYPDTIARYGVYASGMITWELSGLDDSAKYDLTFYGSRNRTDGQSNWIYCGKDSVLQKSDTSRQGATLLGLHSIKGKLQISMKNLKLYEYINAIQIIGTPKKLPIHSVAIPDSSVIHSPNNLVWVKNLSTGPIMGGVQFGQKSGPTKAVFAYGDEQRTIISGLFPGTYIFTQTVQDKYGNLDAADFTITVVPIRIRKAIGFTINTISGIFQFTYDDGNP